MSQCVAELAVDVCDVLDDFDGFEEAVWKVVLDGLIRFAEEMFSLEKEAMVLHTALGAGEA